jgi:pentapeptide MXKDX repeat protein
MFNRSPYVIAALAAFLSLGLALSPAAFAEDMKAEMQGDHAQMKTGAKAHSDKMKSKSHMKHDAMGKDDAMGKESSNPGMGKN